jgi:5-bromo-4-chloroindolyl phosphate hydrolysis protein
MDRDLNEALEHIRTLVKAASESDDIEVVRKYLEMVRVIFDKATAPDASQHDR